MTEEKQNNNRPAIDPNKEHWEMEINLPEIFSVIKKRKELFLTIFMIILSIGIVSSIQLSDFYEAKISLMTTPISLPSFNMNNENIPERLSIPIDTHAKLLKSKSILEDVCKHVNEQMDTKNKIESKQILNKLKVLHSSKEGLLTLKAEASNQESAELLVNTWAEKYCQFSNSIIDGQLQKKYNDIMKEFEETQTELIEKESELNDFSHAEQIMIAETELELQESHLAQNITERIKLNAKSKQLTQKLDSESKDWTALAFVFNETEVSSQENSLTPEQKELKQKATSAKIEYMKAIQDHKTFVSQNHLSTLEDEIEQRKAKLIDDKLLLHDLNARSRVVDIILEGSNNSEYNTPQSMHINSELSELLLLEITSILQGKNLLTIVQGLLEEDLALQKDKLLKQEQYLHSLQQQLQQFDERLEYTQPVYFFYFQKFCTLSQTKNEIEDNLFHNQQLITYYMKNFESLRKKNSELSALILKYKHKLDQLKREIKIINNKYSYLSKIVNDLDLIASSKPKEIQIVPASSFGIYKRPAWIPFLGGIVIFGLFISFVGTYLIDMLQTKKSDPILQSN